MSKDDIHMSKEDKQGYVYILTNPSFREDWVKIGKSSRPVDVRSKELDNTAVPLPFEIYATMKTSKYSQAEKLIHNYIQRFSNLRIRRNREFFNVSPETALSIFYEVSEVLDDAEIEETYKITAMGAGETDAEETSGSDCKNKVWMIPANSKYFNIKGCIDKYGEIYWNQYNNIHKGDTGYIYCSAPDSALRYKFVVLDVELPYSAVMDREKEFYTDLKDFDSVKEHNRIFLIKITESSRSSKVALPNLLDHGMKIAPRGALNLSYKDYKELLKYIEENF
jgi:hypothetical protein